MPYVISVNLSDFAGIVDQSVIAGSIWVPPPASGSSPGAANNVASPGATLTFPGLDGPPQAAAVWVSIPPGDLFRSGAVGPLPASPAPLTVLTFQGQVAPAHAITQAQIDNIINDLLFISLPIPDGNTTSGLWVPTSVTLSSAAITLPQGSATGTLTVNVSGTLVGHTWFNIGVSTTFTLAAMFGMMPSADPVDRPRILAVTAGPNPSLAMKNVPPWLSKAIAPTAASTVASVVEGLINQNIASLVSDTLAHLPNPLEPSMLTQTAVVSMGSISITSAGIDLAIAIGDIFGPGIIPIAGNVTSVPYVINEDITTAAQKMGAAGLIFEGQWDHEYSNRYDVATVIATDPVAHTMVPRGTYVTCIYTKPNLSL